MPHRTASVVRAGGTGLVPSLALLGAPSGAWSGPYIVQTIDVPGAIGGIYPFGVNASGLVSGNYCRRLRGDSRLRLAGRRGHDGG